MKVWEDWFLSPRRGDHASFLRGDGTWANVSNDTHAREDAAMAALVELLKSGSGATCKPEWHDAFMALFEGQQKLTSVVIPPSSDLVKRNQSIVTDVTFLYGYDGEDIRIFWMVGLQPGSEGLSRVEYIINPDMSVDTAGFNDLINVGENGDISIAIERTSSKEHINNKARLIFSTEGNGTKALMDNGEYADVVVKDSKDDAAMRVLAELVKNVEAKNYTCTQDQYDTLKALFKDATKNTCRVIKPSTDFVILHQGAVVSNVVVIYDYEDSKAFQILFDASMEMLQSGTFAFGLGVLLDLSLTRVSVNTNILSMDGSNISICQKFANSSGAGNDNVSINACITLQIKGDGTKALMDNGQYADVPTSVDISSIILNEGTIDFVKQITKSSYDKLYDYITANKHMYLRTYNSTSSAVVCFNSDIISSYIYDAMYLMFFDWNMARMSKIKIDMNTYAVEVQAI